MRYTFSSEFLKIRPPATNFGEAWEAFCLHLLRATGSNNSLMKLGPPDRGIDLYSQTAKTAYQCKSSERGALGTIDAKECIASFDRAIQARPELPWTRYVIALNAPLSGQGYSKLLEFARAKGIPDTDFSILGVEHWNDLCDQFPDEIRELLDYRVFVSESQVLEALKKARYYDSFIDKAAQQLETTPLPITISVNRVPVEITLPFSGELTVEQLLDAVQSLLGISLEWANFPDLGTSCGPSLSLTVDRHAQPFRLKLSELTAEQREKLQLWIKLTWRDKLQEDDKQYDGTKAYFRLALAVDTVPLSTEQDRGRATIDRMEKIIRETIWRAVTELQARDDSERASKNS